MVPRIRNREGIFQEIQDYSDLFLYSYYECPSYSKLFDTPTAQFLGFRISGESAGTSGLKNGRNMMYAFESNTLGNTFNVP